VHHQGLGETRRQTLATGRTDRGADEIGSQLFGPDGRGRQREVEQLVWSVVCGRSESRQPFESRCALLDGIGKGEDVEQERRVGRKTERFRRLDDELTCLVARVPPPAPQGDVCKSPYRELDLSLLSQILR
jgi:hypothetical protein